MPVEFEDNRIAVKAALEDAAVAFLYEAAGEVVSQVQRNLSSEKGRWHSDQAERWQYIVDEGKLEATIGNPMERSLWTEFGTGEFADGGKGRKGYWVYVKGDGSSDSPPKGGKSYTLEEAKQIMAMMRADGLDAHITNGQKPKRPLKKAFTKTKPKIIKRAEEVLKGRMK